MFTSPPCKGFSALLGERASRSERYQALNALTVRGIWLTLEAWRDDPPESLLLENVPRIATRGRALLDRITALLRHYGYAVAETVHDCGVLGGLAQSRKRFLLVARHMERVPPFLYEPGSRPLRAVGDVLGRLPLPGDVAAGGPMHRIPALQWETWVRLAMVQAGGDWRSLNRLQVTGEGVLADYMIVPEPGRRRGYLGVVGWESFAGAISARGLGASRPHNGRFAIADPRFDAAGGDYCQYGVLRWDRPSGAVIGVKSPGQGRFAVADPRLNWQPDAHRNKLAVANWTATARCVTGARAPYSDGLCVADPRVRAVDADTAVVDAMPAAGTRLVAVIRSEDGTWHRPFTTLELAALQGLYDPDSDACLALDGTSDSAHRERIGNAVPPAAAQAIASVIARTLLLAWAGETFLLSSDPIW